MEEVDLSARADRPVKAEDESGDTKMADDKPTYRSWKKKYRKMRIVFDQKMHEGEELHRLEEKALATARRLAVEKDRLLDLLLDNNDCPQVPQDKRFDLSLDPPAEDDTLYLDIDLPSHTRRGPQPRRSYKKLLEEVPHHSYATAGQLFPNLVSDLEAGRESPADPSQGIPHPPSFLAADDIDNYIWEVDNRIANKRIAKGIPTPTPLPTLAPVAHLNGVGGSTLVAANGTREGASGAPSASSASSRDFALRNPVSVYNWLRKHAPKTFLQDGETHPSTERENGDDHHTVSSGRGTARSKGERSSTRASTGATRSKRASAAHSRDKSITAADNLDYIDDDIGVEAPTPSGGGVAAKGKRKRIVDEDAGYRPKGGSSRPTKKKRKSDVGEATTPTAGPKRSRKSVGGDTAMKDD